MRFTSDPPEIEHLKSILAVVKDSLVLAYARVLMKDGVVIKGLVIDLVGPRSKPRPDGGGIEWGGEIEIRPGLAVFYRIDALDIASITPARTNV